MSKKKPLTVVLVELEVPFFFKVDVAEESDSWKLIADVQRMRTSHSMVLLLVRPVELFLLQDKFPADHDCSAACQVSGKKNNTALEHIPSSNKKKAIPSKWQL